MFKEMLKLIRLEIELREEVVSAIEALEDNKRLRRELGSIEIQATTTTRKPRRKGRAKVSRAEKDKRNAKARASYLSKHPKEETTTTTSRLQALPSKPTHIGRGKGSRARTSSAVIATLKRSPSPLTLDEIDTDLEKSGWPYKGRDRKGAIRATLARLKSNGTVSAFKRGTGLETMQMFRLERTNGSVESPVEQLMNGKDEFSREERAEVEDSKEQMLADEARADAEGDPDAREF